MLTKTTSARPYLATRAAFSKRPHHILLTPAVSLPPHTSSASTFESYTGSFLPRLEAAKALVQGPHRFREDTLLHTLTYFENFATDINRPFDRLTLYLL